MRFFSDEETFTPSNSFTACMIAIQARLGSTRLPGKVLKPVMDKPLLFYQVERLRRVQSVEGIVIATTLNPLDQPIIDFCLAEGLHYIRGSEEDVLSRYVAACDAFGLDVVIRVTSDCPLIDPELIEKGYSAFREHYDSLDYLSICHERSFPLGMDFEIIKVDALKKAYHHAQTDAEKEHVTPYIWKRCEEFRLANLQQAQDMSSIRLTVDAKEDFTLIEKILTTLYPKNPEFSMQDIVTLLQQNPEWLKINAHVAQKGV